MSNVKSGQAWTGLFVARDGNGSLSAATTGPAGTLYVNGTSDAASVTITGSNPYKWSVTLPSLTAGDTVSMYITATIAGVATASVVAEGIGDTKRLSDTLTANPASGGIVAASFGAGAIDAAAIKDGAIDAATFAAGAIDAAALAADAGTEIAAAVMASAVESGLTLTNALRLIAAATAGKLSGAATTTVVIRNAVADSKDRITATVDANGNRSAITVDLT